VRLHDFVAEALPRSARRTGSDGRSPAATACLSCSCHAGCTATRRGTAQAVLDHAQPGARLAFSVGNHITRDGQDVYSWKTKALLNVAGRLARLARVIDSTTRSRRAGASSPATPAIVSRQSASALAHAAA
jgi:hypothetical protein